MPKQSINPPIVLPSLAISDKQFARPSIRIEAHGDVALVAGHREFVGNRTARIRQAFSAAGQVLQPAFWWLPLFLSNQDLNSLEPSR